MQCDILISETYSSCIIVYSEKFLFRLVHEGISNRLTEQLEYQMSGEKTILFIFV